MLRRSPMKRTAKPKPAAEREYHRKVALMPCLACGNWPVHVHHVVSDGFKRITRNHRLVIPLCPSCHQNGENAVHKIGHAAFNELNGVDQLERAKRLWEQHDG